MIEMMKSQLQQELRNILTYWMTYLPDEANGGFAGRIDAHNEVDPTADKGAVLNARILWSFSAAYNFEKKEVYLNTAERAFKYIRQYFIDQEYGGVYWTVNYQGKPADTKKQLYAIAFAIYGLSEYYRASQQEEAREIAISLYHDVMRHSYDEERGGYFEAFTRNWGEMEDVRLSVIDANEHKTMNTHLHVIEAFSNLYGIWPDDGLRARIKELLTNFYDHFINLENGHLRLFFDENWNDKSGAVSYGHDVEASWLLLEIALKIDDAEWIDKLKSIALQLAISAFEGMGTDGALWYHYDPQNDHLIKEKHWWVQAEALVGFINAWRVGGDERFLTAAVEVWTFIKDHLIDKFHGEWFWGIDEDGSVMKGKDKAGLWKCPYHNVRACIESIKRL